MRLLQATCKVFTAHCSGQGLQDVYRSKGFRMTYSTTIPRMVGLSGSSAIIVAAFRCLLMFFELTLEDLGITKIGNWRCGAIYSISITSLHGLLVPSEFPQVVLSVEKNELGILAGLQDRVIQTYGGLVHMDFTGSAAESGSPYTELSPTLLPPMYLAYNTSTGGESGAVHNTVRSRWEQRDPELVDGMRVLGTIATTVLWVFTFRTTCLSSSVCAHLSQGILADEAVECLKRQDIIGLAALVEQNFAMRRTLYGDAVVGPLNIRMVQLAKDYGLSAKFTGSGGALLCLRSDGSGW